MIHNAPQNTEAKNDLIYLILWFGSILAFGIVLPVYFTMTQSGTASWLINFQLWATKSISGSASWYPVATGLVAYVIHVFAIIGLLKAGTWLIGLFKKAK